jgi:hypothetical protein
VRLTSRLLHFVAVASVLAWAPVAGAGPSGAIFTTNFDGSFVNGNVYDAKEHVYLNGGPRPNAPCTAAGLPNGEYVFQVTDPPGHVILTTDDAANRTVSVMGGIIVAYGGTRVTGSGACGDLTVALFPFDDTPNPGGEYKVWMTPVAPDGTFEFVHSKCKTDNFKVVPPETVPD